MDNGETNSDSVEVLAELLVEEKGSLDLVVVFADLEALLDGVVRVLDHFFNDPEHSFFFELATEQQMEFQKLDVFLSLLRVC